MCGMESRSARAAARATSLICLIAILGMAHPAGAQNFPTKSIRVVLPFAAGGPVDASIRGIAPKMGETLGQSVVVENRVGAGGTIGIAEVARAAPDGYTLLFTQSSLVVAPLLFKNPGFDAVRDFAPVAHLLSEPIAVMVNPNLGIASLAELIALAKREPGKLTSGSGGIGTAGHLLIEMLKTAAGVDIVHVPYKGVAQAMADFLSGRIQILPAAPTAIAPQVKAGKARVLALASPRRSALLPDVPTSAELGYPGIEAELWMGLLAPAGTPPAVVSLLNAAALKALSDPVNAKRYADQGIEMIGSTPEEFKRFISVENAKLRRVVIAAKIVAE